MTVTINGDNVEETNELQIVQNAADDESILTCVPDCPQEEYVYDYQYSDSDNVATKEVIPSLKPLNLLLSPPERLPNLHHLTPQLPPNP